jgi:phospholipase C
MTTNAWGIISPVAGLLPLMLPVAAQPEDTDPLAKIGHIVVIIEENRSFDNFFASSLAPTASPMPMPMPMPMNWQSKSTVTASRTCPYPRQSTPI